VANNSLLECALLSVCIGIVLTETISRFLGASWFRHDVGVTRDHFQAFRVARNDADRQRSITLAGQSVFKICTVALAILCVLIGLTIAPLAVLPWDEGQQLCYLLLLSIAASSWYAIRVSMVKHRSKDTGLVGEEYGYLDRWLHWLALEPVVVRRLSFELECRFALPRKDSLRAGDRPVYVCGLARSGTTLLVRILERSEIFRSLTYRDMPFVLAPNLWRSMTLHFRKRMIPVERSHKDGVRIDFDSPEAFEEVFWTTFCTYADAGCLSASKPTPEILTLFARYRALVASPHIGPPKPSRQPYRYLSKNNNNLLRLESLCLDASATVLVVYRDPIAATRSLFHQHRRFSDRASVTRFTHSYMRWLVHREFGPQHRPFCFAKTDMDSQLRPESPAYWLDYWIAVHRYLLSMKGTSIRLMNYDALRTRPQPTLDALSELLGVESLGDAQQLGIREQTTVSEVVELDSELCDKAMEIYDRLIESPSNVT